MEKIVCVAGPTASGKTRLAVELAKAYDGEVLSCDSMQNFQPLTDTEMEAVRKVQDIFRFMHRIACTACRCCTDGCPQHLPIRELLEQVAAELKKKEEPKT